MKNNEENEFFKIVQQLAIRVLVQKSLSDLGS